MSLSITPVDPALNRQLLNDYLGEKTGWYHVGPEKYLFPSPFVAQAEQLQNAKTRKIDIWISTQRRVGTTLTQEMVWMIINGCDFEKGRKLHVTERSPEFEMKIWFHPQIEEQVLKKNENHPENHRILKERLLPGNEILHRFNGLGPQVIKSHFPPSLLPKDINQTKPKIIYVARNPKDMVVSFYYLTRLCGCNDYTNTFEQFCNQFMDGNVPNFPYWSHVLEGWNRRHEPNFLFLFYEDIVKDMRAAIIRVADFLEVKLTEEQIDALTDHMDIKNFRNNPSVNNLGRSDGLMNDQESESFIRKGNLRGTGREFTPELEAKFDKWIADNYTKTDLRFPSKI